MTAEPPRSPDSPLDSPPRSLGVAIARYGSARLTLVAALTVVLVLVGVPLLVAVMVALVVALPLSLVLFPKLRRELDAAMAVTGQRRKEQKARLRSQLSGEREARERDGSVSVQEGSVQEVSVQEVSVQEGQGEADGGAERPDQHDRTGAAQDGDEVASPNSVQHPPNG
ncbi:MAG: hypothetical protein QOE32_6069 [Pseudonocardiales bacterium]|nr:hypothetical protein [Pseudonocardiales bacterium]MDT7610604.1 hypothetical protein [Pseudonocardiales bacterium]